MSLFKSGKAITSYTITLVMMLIIYSHVLTITYGETSSSFSQFFKSFYHLFGMLLGEYFSFNCFINYDWFVIDSVKSICHLAINTVQDCSQHLLQFFLLYGIQRNFTLFHHRGLADSFALFFLKGQMPISVVLSIQLENWYSLIFFGRRNVRT